MAECDAHTIAEIVERRQRGPLVYPTVTGALIEGVLGSTGQPATVAVNTPVGPRLVRGVMTALSWDLQQLAQATVIVSDAEDRAALGLTMLPGWP